MSKWLAIIVRRECRYGFLRGTQTPLCALPIPHALCCDEFLDFSELAYPYLVGRVDLTREYIARISGRIYISVTALNEHLDGA